METLAEGAGLRARNDLTAHRYPVRAWHGALWLAGIAVGAAQAWAARDTMEMDGVSYLDLADAWVRADWPAAWNGYWSPLYPWLLAVARVVWKPSWNHEFTVAHLVNFLVYVGALFSFHFFLLQWIRFQRTRAAGASGLLAMPDWALGAIAYCLFFWSSLLLITVARPTPDLCLAAFVYLIAGLLLRIHSGEVGYGSYALLGLLLGLGYLTKAFLFPMAFVYLALAWRPVEGGPPAVRPALVAFAVFGLVAGPYALGLSRAKGYWTFGETARLNYAWYVNGVSIVHWQGNPPGNGAPKHPTREIAPETFEFATPVRGTFPPWFDPSYWSEGVALRFDWRRQIGALFSGLRFSGSLGLRSLWPLAGALVALLLTGQRSGWGSRLAGQRLLWVPTSIAIFLYSLVHVEPRLVAPFLVLFWLGILGAIALPRSDQSRRLLAAAGAIICVLMILKIAAGVPPTVSYRPPWQLEIAADLKERGIQPGDRLAYFGFNDAIWARAAEVQIVVSRAFGAVSDEADFWALDAAARTRLMQSIAATGARAVVLQSFSGITPSADWHAIAVPGSAAKYFVYFL